MKSVVTLLAILFLGSRAFGQGAAPFWEPLGGPAGPNLSFNLLADSNIGQQVGGTIYLFDTVRKSWLPARGEEPPKPQNFNGSFVGLTVPASYWINNILASYKDTIFYSKDSGATWTVVGTFGSGGTGSIVAACLCKTRIIVLDDLARIYSTPDGFLTIDTEAVPERLSTIFADSDTVLVASEKGNLFRSIDWGRNWSKVLDLHDTASNWGTYVWKRGDWWILSTAQLGGSPLYSNLHLAYSKDRGRNWNAMTPPVTKEWPEFEGIDNDGRIYLHFDRGFGVNFRTDDWGATWDSLSVRNPSLIIGRDGIVYSGILFSRDHGNTWDTASSAAVACVPASSLAFLDSSFFVTLEYTNDASLFVSGDNGKTWSRTPASISRPGLLSLRPDSADRIMVNTTRRIYSSGGSSYLCTYHYEPEEGIGVITSGFNVWLARVHNYSFTKADSNGTLMRVFASECYAVESRDSGCSYYSGSYDTLGTKPILQLIESGNDTILGVSTDGLYRGFDLSIPFDTVTPELRGSALPTGAMAKDSTGLIYVAMNDGKIFFTADGAITWNSESSPTDRLAPITHLAAAPNGKLFAVDSNLQTRYTRTWLFDPEKKVWSDITKGLHRSGFPDTAVVTNIWYVNGYAYAGTWNMGLFRSYLPVVGSQSVEDEQHSTPIKLYPNPAGTEVTLTYPTAKNSYGYRILNMAGEIKQRGSILVNSTTLKINVRDLPNGEYELACDAPWPAVKFIVKH